MTKAQWHEKRKESTTRIDNEKWLNELGGKRKLRTYRTFKSRKELEPYLDVLSRNDRQLLCNLRCGTIPLAIETGRWSNTPEPERLCKICDEIKVESEVHFLLECSRYNTIRNHLMVELGGYHELKLGSEQEKLTTLMSNAHKYPCIMKFIRCA